MEEQRVLLGVLCHQKRSHHCVGLRAPCSRLTCTSISGERENPRGSPAHASHFPRRWKHLHNRLQPHERTATRPLESRRFLSCHYFIAVTNVCGVTTPDLQSPAKLIIHILEHIAVPARSSCARRYCCYLGWMLAR